MAMNQKYSHPVIDALGGVRAVARHCGIEPSSVTLWARSGVIPTRRHKTLLELAKQKGVEIGAADWSVHG